MNTPTERLADFAAALRADQNRAYWAGRSAPVAYAKHRENAIALARMILGALESDTDKNAADWAHVGDMAAIAGDLQACAERITQTGEYA